MMQAAPTLLIEIKSFLFSAGVSLGSFLIITKRMGILNQISSVVATAIIGIPQAHSCINATRRLKTQGVFLSCDVSEAFREVHAVKLFCQLSTLSDGFNLLTQQTCSKSIAFIGPCVIS